MAGPSRRFEGVVLAVAALLFVIGSTGLALGGLHTGRPPANGTVVERSAAEVASSDGNPKWHGGGPL